MDADPVDLHWLQEIERNDHARSPNQRMQGALLESIPLFRDNFESTDSYALIQATIDFTNWALMDAFLVAGEFPQQALWAYYTDYYRAQVSNGGHSQFVYNSRFTPLTVGCCLRGLRAIGTDEQLAIFEELVAAVEQADRGGSEEELDAAYKRLDDRYFGLDSTDLLVSKLDAWLRNLSCMQQLSIEDLERTLAQARERNTLFTHRAREYEELRRAYERSSATHRVIRSLCAASGRIFRGLTAGATLPMRKVSPAAPDRREFCWGVMTDQGVHHVFFYKHKRFFRTSLRAEMWLADAPQAAAACAVSASDYEEIIPHWMRQS